MTEADQTGTVVTNTSQFSRELSHVNPGEASHLNEDELNGIEFNDDELNDLFSNIAGLQPDDMQTNAFMGAANHALLDTEAFDTLTDTTNSILDDIGDFAVSQTGSVDVLSQFMAFDHARTSPSSSSRQNSDASTSDDFIATPATSIGRPRSRTDPSSCQCRRSILRVLSDVETNILSASASNIYAILSYQRRITAASNDILTSRICNCRIKFFGLLGIIGEKITSLSEAIITAFVCRMKEQNDSVTDFGESSSSPRNSAIRLGEFQVQTLQEFKVVSAAVIKLQLKYSVNFVSRTRELAISMNRLAQAQSLKKLESRLKELFLKMQRCSELESDFCEI